MYSNDIANYIDTLRDYASRSAFVLEIGPAKGDGSTAAFSEGMELSTKKDKLFISIDIRDYMEIKPQLPYWHLVIGDSRENQTFHDVMEVEGIYKPADLIFIDTHHTYEHMQQELAIWKGLAGPKTIWLFHDTYMMGEYNHMTDAIEEFAKESKIWDYVDISIEAHGLGALLPRIGGK